MTDRVRAIGEMGNGNPAVNDADNGMALANLN
jgi:hypothetical protein